MKNQYSIPFAKFFVSCIGTVILLTITGVASNAQVIVDNININDDKEIEYIQFMYYVEKSTFRPVYSIDYGSIESDTPDGANQRIIIDEVEITYTMTPVKVLNKLYNAGWEYLGDATYIPIPMRDNWHVFTLRRKK